MSDWADRPPAAILLGLQSPDTEVSPIVKRPLFLLVAVLALVLAACGGETADASPAAEPTPDATPTPEVTPTPEPEPTDDPDTGALPSFDLDGDPELAARFPSTVGGQPLTVQSFRGDLFAGMGGVDESFQEFLDATGADLEDVSVAFGGLADSAESLLSVAAFRVVGVSQDRLEEEFLGSAGEEVEDLSRETIGGKEVWAASYDMDEMGTTGVYVYTKDDTVYWLTGPEELVAEILAALP